MSPAKVALLVVTLIIFMVAAVGITVPVLQLVPLGLAFLVLSMLVP